MNSIQLFRRLMNLPGNHSSLVLPGLPKNRIVPAVLPKIIKNEIGLPPTKGPFQRIPLALSILSYYQSKRSQDKKFFTTAALTSAAVLSGIGYSTVYADEDAKKFSSNSSSTITHLEYAQLASAAYNANPNTAESRAPEGWTRVYHDYREANWGFGAALFKKDGNYVIVIRGTENLWDLVKDFGMIFSQNPSDQAALFFTKALDHIKNNPPKKDDIANSANSSHKDTQDTKKSETTSGMNKRPRLNDEPWIDALRFVKNDDVGDIKGLSVKDAQAAKEVEKILAILNQSTASGLSLAQLLVLSTAVPLYAALAASAINAIAPGYGVLGGAALTTVGLTAILAELSSQFNASLSEKAEQLTECFKNLDILSKQHITATGHSLGATMVEICSIKFNIKCVTFDSPGCAEILKNTHLKDPHAKYPNITGFLAAPHSINTLYSHVGNNYRLKLPHSALVGTSFINGTAGTTSRGALWTGAILAIAAPFTGGATLPAAGYAFATAAGAKAIEISSGAIRNVSWALRQHSLETFIKALEAASAEDAIRFQVVSWPSFWQNNFGARAARGLTGLIPFYGTNRSIFNFYRDEEVDEAQIETMPGYEVKDSFKDKVRP
jgi:hypothetical protein